MALCGPATPHADTWLAPLRPHSATRARHRRGAASPSTWPIGITQSIVHCRASNWCENRQQLIVRCRLTSQRNSLPDEN